MPAPRRVAVLLLKINQPKRYAADITAGRMRAMPSSRLWRIKMKNRLSRIALPFEKTGKTWFFISDTHFKSLATFPPCASFGNTSNPFAGGGFCWLWLASRRYWPCSTPLFLGKIIDKYAHTPLWWNKKGCISPCGGSRLASGIFENFNPNQPILKAKKWNRCSLFTAWQIVFP